MIHSACVWMLAAAAAGADPGPPAGPVEVPAMLIKMIERVDVPARETGVLEAVNVSEGQMVEEGSVLAQIVDTEIRISAERSKNEVEIARLKAKNDINIRYSKKSVEVAKAELQRSLDAVKKYPKAVSDSELDRLRLLVQKATLEIEQSEQDFTIAGFTRQIKDSEYRAIQENVKRFQITAPLGGVVVQVARHRGEWVKPGETVLRILRLDRLRAEGFLDARRVHQGLQGRRVKLTVDLPEAAGTEFPGTIVFLDPEIDPVNAQVRVWAEFDNKDLRLRPGMRAKMTVDMRPGAGKED